MYLVIKQKLIINQIKNYNYENNKFIKRNSCNVSCYV